ncbi:MAG: hypothetical protein WD356_10550 [Pseudomonadales bacterium]
MYQANTWRAQGTGSDSNRSEKGRSEKSRYEKIIQARKLSHSALAMRAAKGMGRSRQKEKTGRVVCHHLLKMLESGDGEHSSRGSCRDDKGLELHVREQQALGQQERAQQYSLHL